MTPSQRLHLSARQAGDQAQRLLHWLRAGKPGRPEVAGLVDEVESIAGAVGRIVDAIDQPPAVGIVGATGSGKTALLAAMSGGPDRNLRAEFANREASLDTMASVVPHRGGARIATAIRLMASEPPAAPRGFPVHLRLLGQLDLVKLVYRAYAVNIAAATRPSQRAVAALFADVERHLQPRAVPGLSGRDIIDLREDLHGFDPGSPLLRTLLASGYWDRLAVTVAHLPETERTRLFALLWNDEPVLTAIYGLLLAAIEKVGHATDLFCELGAIVAREPATGWMVPHRSSVVSADTLAGLAHALGPVPVSTVQVAGRFGGTLAMDHAVVAALAAELPLTLPSAPVETMPATDVVLFPGAPQLVDAVRDEAPGQAAGEYAGGGLGIDVAVAMFAHAKSAYLLERATRRHHLASLVVCIDPAQPPDDAMADAIGNWIEQTQGAQPHHRERVRTGLFVVASRPTDPVDAPVRLAPWREAADDGSVRAWLDRGLGVDQDWPREWTPNSRFENVFALYRPTRTASGARPGETHLRLVQGEPVQAAVPNGAETLLRPLALVASPAKKHRQLGLALAEQRRRLRSRLLRHHMSNDPLEIAEWRRQVVNVAASRFRRRSASGDGVLGAGTFIASLGAGEDELAAAILERLRIQDSTGETARSAAIATPANPGSVQENPSIRHDSAAAALTYWLRVVRQAARSARFCRRLGVPQTVLQHVVDEIAIGAVRTGLAPELTAAFSRAPGLGGSSDGRAVHLAATGARLIGVYLASIPKGAAMAAPAALIAAAEGRALATTDASSRGAEAENRGGAGRRAAFGGVTWAAAMNVLVEANIEAVSGLVDSPERDRELGELLSGFASSPFEVEL